MIHKGGLNEIFEQSEFTNIMLQIRWAQVWVCVTDSPFQRYPLITSFNEGSLPGVTLCSDGEGVGEVWDVQTLFSHKL